MNSKRLKEIVQTLHDRKEMVLGDFIADEYVLGITSRISREAPVLILQYASQKIIPGGAGNAAANLAALGAKVTSVGVMGNDEVGKEMSRQLEQRGVDVSLMIRQNDEVTTTKTRIMAGGPHSSQQQVVRVDRGEFKPLSKSSENQLLCALEEKIKSVDALLVSDYHYGVLSSGVIEKINLMAKEDRKIITVDSRHQMMYFRGVTALTPNEPEVEQILNVRLDDDETVRKAGEEIMRRTGCENVLMTRGRKGMALTGASGKSELFPIVGTDEIADVTGAGDTVIAIFTLALCGGATTSEAAQLANIGGGIVVMKRGTATVNPDELEQVLTRL